MMKVAVFGLMIHNEVPTSPAASGCVSDRTDVNAKLFSFVIGVRFWWTGLAYTGADRLLLGFGCLAVFPIFCVAGGRLASFSGCGSGSKFARMAKDIMDFFERAFGSGGHGIHCYVLMIDF